MTSAEYQKKYGNKGKGRTKKKAAPPPIRASVCPVDLHPNQIYFYGNVPSMKNHKNIYCKDQKGKCLNRPKVLLSDEAQQYAEHLAYQQVTQYKRWLEIIKGVEIDKLKKFVLFYQFIRPSRKSIFDYSNALEILQDGLTSKLYIPQKKTATKYKHTGKVDNVPNLGKYLRWIPEDNNTRTVPALHPVDLYYADSPGVIISFFPSFKEYVNFLVVERIGI